MKFASEWQSSLLSINVKYVFPRNLLNFAYCLLFVSLYKNEYIEDINSDLTYIFYFICCIP